MLRGAGICGSADRNRPVTLGGGSVASAPGIAAVAGPAAAAAAAYALVKWGFAKACD